MAKIPLGHGRIWYLNCWVKEEGERKKERRRESKKNRDWRGDGRKKKGLLR